MYRDEAEQRYVQYVMTAGNPAWFVWEYVRRLPVAVLQSELSDMLSGYDVLIEEIGDEE